MSTLMLRVQYPGTSQAWSSHGLARSSIFLVFAFLVEDLHCGSADGSPLPGATHRRRVSFHHRLLSALDSCRVSATCAPYSRYVAHLVAPDRCAHRASSESANWRLAHGKGFASITFLQKDISRLVDKSCDM